jgi:uncharacterized membrane protein
MILWLALAAGLAYGMSALTVIALVVAWSDSRQHLRLTVPRSILGGPNDGGTLTITEPNGAGQGLLFSGIYFALALVSLLIVTRLCSDYYRSRSSRWAGLLLGVPCGLVLGPVAGVGIGWIANGFSF